MTLASLIQDNLDAKRIVIMDGATGTEIARRGITIHGDRTWSANANMLFPDQVRNIHQDYIRAGAEIITTNTFSTVEIHWQSINYPNKQRKSISSL